MNPILSSYFNLLNEAAKDRLSYYVYERHFNMPFSVHLYFDGKNGSKHNAWGSGVDLDEALGKALMELIERITFSYYSPLYFRKLHRSWIYKKRSVFDLSSTYSIPVRNLHPTNSNGIAIHINKSEAKERAKHELIERHTILYCYLNSIYPHGSFSKKIGRKTCKFFFWEGPDNTKVVVGSIKAGNGYYYSSACHQTLEESANKAALELNSFIYLENPDTVKELESKIMKDDIDSFNRYHRFSGDTSAYQFLEKKSNLPIPQLQKDSFYFTEIPQPPIFKGLFKFPCIRVIHPDAQQLFFDNWDRRYVNPRLQAPTNLPEFPHIIA